MDQLPERLPAPLVRAQQWSAVLLQVWTCHTGASEVGGWRCCSDGDRGCLGLEDTATSLGMFGNRDSVPGEIISLTNLQGLEALTSDRGAPCGQESDQPGLKE